MFTSSRWVAICWMAALAGCNSSEHGEVVSSGSGQGGDSSAATASGSGAGPGVGGAGATGPAACARPPDARPASLFVAADGSDSNLCTDTAPCQSFDRAYEVAQPGETVLVKAGSYPVQRVLRDAAKEAASERVVFIADGAVTLAELETGYRNDYSNLGSKHVEFRGMNVTGALATWLGSEDVVFRDMDAARVVFTSSTNVQLIGGDIGPNVDGVSHINTCFDVSTDFQCPGPKDIIIDGARFHDFLISDPEPHAECIMLWGYDTDGVTIRNSTFERCTDFDILVKAPSSRNIVLENNFLDEPMPGDVATTQCAPGCPRGGNAIRIADEAHDGVSIIHNTMLGGLGIDPSNTNVLVRGNIGKKSPGEFFCGWPGTKDHNLWATNECSPTDIQVTSLADVVVDTDPLDGTMDLHLKVGSPAIDSGDSTDYPPLDIDCDTRPRGPQPDIGADESE